MLSFQEFSSLKIKNRGHALTKRLTGLKISLCQMKIAPGRPDINAGYIINEIKSAEERNVDIIVFPEMCATGYIVGDIFEDDCFIADVQYWNDRIIESTRNKNITVIFGTVIISHDKKGEDGRQRLHNAAIVANSGRLVKSISKTLQPNYRFFNDDKHFYSGRKRAQEKNADIRDILFPVEIQTRIGRIKIGVILCEDMWHEDYYVNPAKILADKGAEIIFNLSASPWTWQKNRKRHHVVKNLLNECKVPFVYVNNTGAQNTGKNIIVFDGNSTVYNKRGEIIFEIPPYADGSRDLIFNSNIEPLGPKTPNDTEELYDAIICATKSMVPGGEKIIVGLSGGIDSAVVLTLMVDVFGSERVIAVNMPMPSNSQKTKNMAETIARNLGVEYMVIPINKLVNETCKSTGAESDTLTYENIQARARQNILAALAQKIGGRFPCCSNKTEIAFGYGTLYGDIAGFFTPLGDSVKREVRQIADYQNKARFKREVIPQECIDQTPTAELKRNQKDPFHYGNLNFRGYHDEMIRAFTEFRKNPEWFLEKYIKGGLEWELKLEPGTLAKLFPTAQDFLQDLRHWWTQFNRSYFKRVQCPPIPIVSKRGFGRDMEESMMPTHFTQRFLELEKQLIS